MPADSRREALTKAIRRDVPRRPGVYLCRDEPGNTLCVGKSVNLRQRMLSYFGPGQAGPEHRMRHLVFSIHGFDFRETQSELLARLLEDVLIKRERPIHNKRQRERDDYRYIVLTDDPYPTCRIVDREADADGTVFGPLHDGYLAADVLRVINRHFRLRSCVDPVPVRRSANFELGLCTGPCRGRISVPEYRAIADRVVDFPNGDYRWIAARLQQEMTTRAAALDYERAAALKDELSFCRNFCSRQRFIHDFRTRRVTLRESVPGQDDSRFAYHFVRGNLVEVTTGADGPRVPNIAAELLDTVTNARWVLDRANVIHAWLNRNGAHTITVGDGSASRPVLVNEV